MIASLADVTASLCAGAADNTRVALHFANAAKRVTMQPHVNEVVNQKALLRKLRDEVALLRKQLVRTALSACLCL